MTDRTCSWRECSVSLAGKARQARYCSTKCTDKARYERDREKVITRTQRYYQANRAKVSARHAARRDQIAEYMAAWRARNPELVRQHNQKRRALLADAPGDGVTALDWLAILEWAEHRCIYCYQSMATVHMEHVVPLSQGGAHDITNVGPACRFCNLSKKDRSVDEWLPGWVAPWWIEYPVV
jgi:5-methylcytosine-specific restriction endonuclease McrA